MNARRSSQRGYSLTEMLTVVALIGVLSLVTIPQFMNFYRANKLKAGMRAFTMEVRAARQLAITQRRRVAVTFAVGRDPAGYGRGQYAIWSRNDDGTWGRLEEHFLPADRTDPIYFGSTTFTNAVENGANLGGDDRPDIVFLPNGTISNMPAGAANLIIRTDYKIAKPIIRMTMHPSGNFNTVSQ